MSTGRVALTRLASIPVLALLVSLVLFVLAQRAPFDPVLALLGERALTLDGATLEALRAQYADQGAVQQWWSWWTQAITGDLGASTSQRQPVVDVVLQRLPWSLTLMGVALVLAVVSGVVLGTLAAVRSGGHLDRAITSASLALQAAPAFWLALLAVSFFAVTLGWLPAGGATSPGATTVAPLDLIRHAVLPVLVLALSQLPWFALVVRDAVGDSLAGPAVLGAWSRGVPHRALLIRHAVRPALLPLTTVVGVRLPELVTGAVLVEAVFSWPGIAAATVDAALSLDFALLAALTVLSTVLVVLGNLAADLMYRVVDPRVGEVDG